MSGMGVVSGGVAVSGGGGDGGTIFRDVLMPEDFGPTGTADDTATLQACLDAVPTSGALVRLSKLYAIPDGGLACANPVVIEGMGVLYQDLTRGSGLTMEASTGTLLHLSAPGSRVTRLALYHPSAGVRDPGLIGVDCLAANFTQVENNIISGFSTAARLSGVYWTFRANVVRDFILRGLDAQFGPSGPDAGDPFASDNIFDRTGTDVANGIIGGDAIYLRNIGGFKSANNKVNAPSSNPFDHGVFFEAEALKTSTIVNLIGGSYQGCVTCLEIGGDATANFTGLQVTGTEMSSLGLAGSTGILCSAPGVRGVEIDAHIGGCDTAVDLQNVKHASVRVNGHDLAVAGVRVRSLCRQIHVSDDSTFDGPTGVKAVVYDSAGLQLRTAQEFEQWIPFEFADASAHDLFEIGVNPFAPVHVEVWVDGVNQGVGAFSHYLHRVVTGGGAGADSSVSAALPDEYTGTGLLTSTFLTSGLGGPMRYQITKGGGTSNPGRLKVRVSGTGLSYFKLSNRDN